MNEWKIREPSTFDLLRSDFWPVPSEGCFFLCTFSIFFLLNHHLFQCWWNYNILFLFVDLTDDTPDCDVSATKEHSVVCIIDEILDLYCENVDV